MLMNSNAAQSPDSQSDPHRTTDSTHAVLVVPMRRRYRADFWRGEKVATLLTMRSEGRSATEISIAVGISESAVKAKILDLRNAGVPIPKYKSGSRKGMVVERQYAVSVPLSAETQLQATRRAGRLQHYWHARGYPMARFWIDDSGRTEHGDVIYTVRSNLVGGLPPGGPRG